MKKIILCIILVLLVVTSAFALKNISITQDTEAVSIEVVENPLPVEEEPQKQPEKELRRINK